jgi:hypothetical protein
VAAGALNYGASGEREAIPNCGASLAHSIHNHARTSALRDGDNVEYRILPSAALCFCTESDLPTKSKSGPRYARPKPHNTQHREIFSPQSESSPLRYFSAVLPWNLSIYRCRTNFFTTLNYQVSELDVPTLECGVHMILGRKKLKVILPSQNNALRHLNRLKFQLCHIAALSFVPLASPYRDYAIALLPASSVL